MVTTPAAAIAADAHAKPAVSWAFIAVYVLAQFGIWISLLTPVVLTIALRVGEISGEAEKGRSLGIVLAIGAFVSMVTTPIWGALSDRTQSRYGRRRPWLIGGLICSGIGLFVLGSAQSILVLGLGWIICQASFNAMQAASMAILPDVIPAKQQGLVSGLLSMTMTAGTFTGTWLTQFTQASPLAMFMAPFAITLVAILALVVMLPDPPLRANLHPDTRRHGFGRLLMSLFAPFRDGDFNWAFASRFLIMMAWAFLITYQVFFLMDGLGLSRQDALEVMVTSSGIVAVATISASFIGGLLSDLIGRRKPLIFAAAAIEGAGFLLIATAGSVDQFLLGMAVGSLGKGLYFGVDLALIAAILPSRQDAAKDLGTFQIANSLPQSLAPAVAPMLLTIGGSTAAGGGNYAAVYIFAALCSLVGAAVILPVRRSK